MIKPQSQKDKSTYIQAAGKHQSLPKNRNNESSPRVGTSAVIQNSAFFLLQDVWQLEQCLETWKTESQVSLQLPQICPQSPRQQPLRYSKGNLSLLLRLFSLP